MSDRRRAIIFACSALGECLDPLLSPEVAERLTYLDYGYHRSPNELRQALQEKLDSLPEPAIVVLGYGLCGNGLLGLEAGRHTLIIPRADDCITLLLGSRERYQEEFRREPGTYYVSRGWIESGSDPLREYLRYRETYGDEEALWLVDEQYRHYRRLALVGHSPEEIEGSRSRALEIARFCEHWGMRYEEIVGSDALLRRLLEAAENPEVELDSALLRIPPGGRVEQREFLR